MGENGWLPINSINDCCRYWGYCLRHLDFNIWAWKTEFWSIIIDFLVRLWFVLFGFWNKSHRDHYPQYITKIAPTRGTKIRPKNIKEYNTTLDERELYYLIWFLYDFFKIIGRKKQAGLHLKCTGYVADKNDKVVRFFVTPQV